MAFRKAFQKFTTPVHEQDRAKLRDFCAAVPGAIPIAEVAPRAEATVVGEITSVRIVPRPDGSPWLEATISDGSGALVALWTGRKKIAGIKGGQRLVITGRGSPSGPGGRLLIYNPVYELL